MAGESVDNRKAVGRHRPTKKQRETVSNRERNGEKQTEAQREMERNENREREMEQSLLLA